MYPVYQCVQQAWTDIDVGRQWMFDEPDSFAYVHAGVLRTRAYVSIVLQLKSEGAVYSHIPSQSKQKLFLGLP